MLIPAARNKVCGIASRLRRIYISRGEREIRIYVKYTIYSASVCACTGAIYGCKYHDIIRAPPPVKKEADITCGLLYTWGGGCSSLCC